MIKKRYNERYHLENVIMKLKYFLMVLGVITAGLLCGNVFAKNLGAVSGTIDLTVDGEESALWTKYYKDIQICIPGYR